MKVRLVQTEGHAPWKPGEIVTVQVTTDDGDGAYGCETLETYPPNLKARHTSDVADLKDRHALQLKTWQAQYEEALAVRSAQTAEGSE